MIAIVRDAFRALFYSLSAICSHESNCFFKNEKKDKKLETTNS